MSWMDDVICPYLGELGVAAGKMRRVPVRSSNFVVFTNCHMRVTVFVSIGSLCLELQSCPNPLICNYIINF
jgi:hypothetical protein